jgi:hypothetical protein
VSRDFLSLISLIQRKWKLRQCPTREGLQPINTVLDPSINVDRSVG